MNATKFQVFNILCKYCFFHLHASNFNFYWTKLNYPGKVKILKYSKYKLAPFYIATPIIRNIRGLCAHFSRSNFAFSCWPFCNPFVHFEIIRIQIFEDFLVLISVSKYYLDLIFHRPDINLFWGQFSDHKNVWARLV